MYLFKLEFSLDTCPGVKLLDHMASLIAQLVKNPPAMQETWVLFLGWEDPMDRGVWQAAAHGVAKSRT